MSRPGTPSWSLKRRLTGRVLGLVIGGWLLTIVLATLVLDHEINEMFDEELHALVETTALYLDAVQRPVIARNIGVETNDGERILRIMPADGTMTPAPWPPVPADGFHDLQGWRILRKTTEGVAIEAAQSKAWRREEMLEAASALLVLALPLVGLLLWGLGRTVAETTAPVTALARQVGGRRPDDDTPIRAEGLPEELLPLASAFDGYLARIESVRRAERDFVANAAHELRTPLAAIRGRLEVSDDSDATATLPMIDALTRRVERLLQLARLDAGVAIGRGPTDLVRVLRLLIDEIRPLSPHPIRFDDGDVESLMICADADALAILLRNILENAVEHGTGEVRLRLSANGQLSIENPTDTHALPAARFARGSGSTGQGLGLSIIEALAKAMDITVSQRAGSGRLALDLRFPLAAQPS